MGDILKELGYGCTVTTSHCKEMLSLFLPLNEVRLSKLLGTIARTQVDFDDAQNVHSSFCSALGSSVNVDTSLLKSWNVDVLVDSIKQLVRGCLFLRTFLLFFVVMNWPKRLAHIGHYSLFLYWCSECRLQIQIGHVLWKILIMKVSTFLTKLHFLF